MGNAFFDEDAAQFLAPALSGRLAPAPSDPLAPLQYKQAAAEGRHCITGEGGAHVDVLSRGQGSAREGCDDVADAGKDGAPNTHSHGSSLGPQWLHASLGLEYKAAQVDLAASDIVSASHIVPASPCSLPRSK